MSDLFNSSLGMNINDSFYRKNRINILTKDVVTDFNTYRNWSEFDLNLPGIQQSSEKGGNPTPVIGKGIKSLFSNVAAVYADTPIRQELNLPLIDSPENRRRIRQKTDCSIKTLVRESAAGTMGRSVYSYADFMYCKHLGKISNNYLITLRKFPSPCGDHIMYSSMEEEKYNMHAPDMGRLVTWMGVSGNDMSSILKYNYTIPWQENKAPKDEKPSGVGGEIGPLGKMFNFMDTKYNDRVVQGLETSQVGSSLAGKLGGKGGYASRASGTPMLSAQDLYYQNANRVVSSRQNTIQSVMVAGGKDEGLGFTHDIKLVFDYELRSYDGVNGRSAMLDLLANILMVTYLQGRFFAGSYRPVDNYQSNVFANLPIFTDSAAGNLKTPSDVMDSVWDSIESVKQTFIGKGGSSIKGTIKTALTGGIMDLLGGMINSLGRPQKYAMTSLITSTPTGQWHLTIGNPRNPILSIGNLICSSAEIEHYGPLGLDDFPTGLKVTVSLKHAKARDSVNIEQMYLHGNNRIYSPMGPKIENMYLAATDYKKTNDSKKNKNINNKNTDRFSRDTINTSLSSIGDDIVENTSKAGDYIYKKFFGTNNTNSIILTSNEGLIGGDVKKNKN